MKTSLRVLSLFVLASLLFAATTACSSQKDISKPSVDSVVTESGTEETEPAEKLLHGDLPELDLGGYRMNILGWFSPTLPLWRTESMRRV